MPAHLFLRVGMYADGVATSLRSTDDNRQYLKACLSPYAYGHNLKLLIANARMAGMTSTALKAAAYASKEDAGQELTPGGRLSCVDCAGIGSPETALSLVRFARWNEVLDIPIPSSFGENPAYNKGMFYYARAMALYATGKPASTEVTEATNAAADDFFSAKVVPLELAAARAWHVENNLTAAIASLDAAITAVEALPYVEPPRFYYPNRHCLGFLLLKTNATRALSVFQKDLTNFPENAWSLFGAAHALKLLGKVQAAGEYTERGNVAWQNADVEFLSPCPQLA